MSALLYPVFNFFANNRAAQWIAGIIAAVFLLKTRDALRERQVKKRVKREVIDDIQEQTNERIEQAEDAGRTTADLNAEQLRRLAAQSPHNRGRVQRPRAD